MTFNVGMHSENPNADNSHFRLSWSVLSTSLFVLSIAALGTLAVVVAVKDVDILSTVALALAVLSFSSQIIVSLLQAQETAKVNSETTSALVEMRATTDSLLSNQRDQFDKILSAFLGAGRATAETAAETTVGDLSETDDDAETLQFQSTDDSFISNFQREILLRNTISARASDDIKRHPTDLDTLPSESEVSAVLPLIKDLNPLAVNQLRKIWSGVKTAELRGNPAIARLRRTGVTQPQASNDLINRGLVGLFSAPDEGQAGSAEYTLTPAGRTVARTLFSPVSKPKWLLDKFFGSSQGS